jgi:hypothetical protein
VIYTPTEGDAIQNYSRLFRRPEGCFLNINDQDRIEEFLSNFGRGADVDYIVVSDGEEVKKSSFVLKSNSHPLIADTGHRRPRCGLHINIRCQVGPHNLMCWNSPFSTVARGSGLRYRCMFWGSGFSAPG